MRQTVSDAMMCFRKILLHTGLFFMLLVCGCDENDYYDHVPPSGMGSLVLDNNSGDDISVFLDGVETLNLDGSDEEIQDLQPGVYRIVLSADHTERSYSADVDILEGRLTILDIRASSATSYYYYDVLKTYD